MSYIAFGIGRLCTHAYEAILNASQRTNTEIRMKAMTRNMTIALTLLALTGCGSMTHRERDTVVGAGVGAAAGAAITGDVGGAVGGGIVGGVIGNQVGKH